MFYLELTLFILTWGTLLHYLMIGYLAMNICNAFKPPNNCPAPVVREIIHSALWAISILAVNSIAINVVKQYSHIDQMAEYLLTPAYKIWLLYLIISAEAIGALCLLWDFKLRTGPLTASGLILLMLGITFAHGYGRDIFTSRIIDLSLIVLLYYFERRSENKKLFSSTYVA